MFLLLHPNPFFFHNKTPTNISALSFFAWWCGEGIQWTMNGVQTVWGPSMGTEGVGQARTLTYRYRLLSSSTTSVATGPVGPQSYHSITETHAFVPRRVGRRWTEGSRLCCLRRAALEQTGQWPALGSAWLPPAPKARPQGALPKASLPDIQGAQSCCLPLPKPSSLPFLTSQGALFPALPGWSASEEHGSKDGQAKVEMGFQALEAQSGP